MKEIDVNGLSEKERDGFKKAWEEYWFKIKPMWERLSDDQAEEFILCSKFWIAMRNTNQISSHNNRITTKLK